MKITVSKQPQPKRISECNFQALKKQYLNDRRNNNSSMASNRSSRHSQYMQVNYLKNFAYKVSPEIHKKIPLQKEQENFRDYLLEIKTDEQKLHEVNNQIKYKYFTKNKTAAISRNTHKSHQQVTTTENLSHKNANQNHIQLFDPIEYLEEKKIKRQQKLLSKTKKLKQIHSFTDDIESVKYLEQAPQIKLPHSLPFFEKQSFDSFFPQQQNYRQKTHQQINNEINKILQKSIKFQSQSKIGSQKMKSYKSRSQLQKDTANKIKTERKSIIKMIQSSEKNKSQQKTHKNSLVSVDEIPAKQKYAIDFISYVRTKTKNQLDKYVYEKLVKQPDRDLQKFQQFMLKEVKFENEENKHKIERFFIKMREQFRRVQKYNKKGSNFDWRSKSMQLDEMKKQDKMLQKSKLFEDKIKKHQTYHKAFAINSRTSFLQNLEDKRLKSKADRIMQDYIHLKNQQLKKRTEQLYKKQQTSLNKNGDENIEEKQEITQ